MSEKVTSVEIEALMNRLGLEPTPANKDRDIFSMLTEIVARIEDLEAE